MTVHSTIPKMVMLKGGPTLYGETHVRKWSQQKCVNRGAGCANASVDHLWSTCTLNSNHYLHMRRKCHENSNSCLFERIEVRITITNHGSRGIDCQRLPTVPPHKPPLSAVTSRFFRQSETAFRVTAVDHGRSWQAKQWPMTRGLTMDHYMPQEWVRLFDWLAN